MARYTGPVCKLCRREMTKLLLKGSRCVTDKCALERKKYSPGPKTRRRPKVSEYGTQLREKQKIKRLYGVLERQFRNYFKEASRRKGITGDNLIGLLESRLDNIVYRMAFASSRAQARQLIRHGHFLVNGRPVSISSYQLRAGDIIEVKEKSKKNIAIKEAIKLAIRGEVPSWLSMDTENLKGRVLSIPTRDQIDLPIKEQLVVELYSK